MAIVQVAYTGMMGDKSMRVYVCALIHLVRNWEDVKMYPLIICKLLLVYISYENICVIVIVITHNII